jgi:hypothetical protein
MTRHTLQLRGTPRSRAALAAVSASNDSTEVSIVASEQATVKVNSRTMEARTIYKAKLDHGVGYERMKQNHWMLSVG